MLDITRIREHPDQIREGIAHKGADPALVDTFLTHDTAWRDVVQELDALKAKQNELSKQLASSKDEALLREAEGVKQEIKARTELERTLQEQRESALRDMPNIPFNDVTVGADENENVELRKVGEVPQFPFEPRDHLAIGEMLGLINTEQAAVVSGARFGYLLGDAVLLEFALVRLIFDIVQEKGFRPIVPPVLVRPEIMEAMGKGKFVEEHDAFAVSEDGLYLVGSAEHSIGPLHMNHTFNEDDLPRRYIGFSTAFRREAGSYGKDTRGLWRVHQFDKVELLSFTTPDQSEAEHQTLLGVQEELVQTLQLPYRVMEICTGDMTWADARQFDIETWLPSARGYRETHSCSNTTDFQARGIQARFKPKGVQGKPEYVHMLNATGVAMGRMIAAILENYQQEDGTVRVPEALQGYVGRDIITPYGTPQT